MRFLHCSDFHGNQRWFDWLAARAAKFDLVCLTGDHLDLLDTERIDSQVRMVKAALGRIATPLALCSGNNDSFSAPEAPPGLHQAAWLKGLRRAGLWVDGDVFEAGGLRFRCVGWNEQLPSAQGNEVWLSHAPPARAPVAIDSSGADVGGEILGERCRAGTGPGGLLAGHQHDPLRWMCRVGQTWCFNPGYNSRGIEPNHIILDTTEHIVELVRDGRTADKINIGYPA
jgi:predicted phosphodiesterase